MEKSENDSVEDKIDQGHSENVNEQKPDNSSTNKDEDRWEDKLNEAYGKQDDLQNKYLRVHADLENLKKRAIREREDAVQRTRSQLIGDLLPIIDAFQMGLSEASKYDVAKQFTDGFEMAIKQLENILGEYGLVVIDPLNNEFDPSQHEAISHEFNDEIKDGNVVKTIRCGYKLGNKLLRPASVILAKTNTSEI